MPILANTGFGLPEFLEKPTREAGKQAFAGVANLWRLLSGVEGAEFDTDPVQLKEQSANQLDHAASTYRTVANDIGESKVGGLTPFEKRLAGVNYEEFELFQNEPIPLRDSYRELAMRLELLASEIRALDVRQLQPGDEAKHAYDLAPQAFRIMQHWEEAATLGRAIAVLNRRKSQPTR